MTSTNQLATSVWRVSLQVISVLVIILYPFAIYFGLQYGGIQLIAPIIILLFAVRLCLLRTKVKQLLWIARLGIGLGIVLAVASWLLKVNHLLLYYPIIVSLSLLAVFSYSLYMPPSIVERLARLTEPDLPAQAIAYTRKVTQLWCVFFIINATIATITCMMSDLIYWTLYNGLISYLLIGLLMAGEWLVRQRVRRVKV